MRILELLIAGNPEAQRAWVHELRFFLAREAREVGTLAGNEADFPGNMSTFY